MIAKSLFATLLIFAVCCVAVEAAPEKKTGWIPSAVITDLSGIVHKVAGRPEPTLEDCYRTQQLASAVLAAHPEVQKFELSCDPVKK
jgi:hypothetical protein